MLQLQTIITILLKCQLGRNFEIPSTWTSVRFLEEGKKFFSRREPNVFFNGGNGVETSFFHHEDIFLHKL